MGNPPLESPPKVPFNIASFLALHAERRLSCISQFSLYLFSNAVAKAALSFRRNSTPSASWHALEGYSHALRYEVSPFGVDIVMVELWPFGTGLLSSGFVQFRPEIGYNTHSISSLLRCSTKPGPTFPQLRIFSGKNRGLFCCWKKNEKKRYPV